MPRVANLDPPGRHTPLLACGSEYLVSACPERPAKADAR